MESCRGYMVERLEHCWRLSIRMQPSRSEKSKLYQFTPNFSTHFQLGCVLHMNGVHSQMCGGLEIECAVAVPCVSEKNSADIP